MVRVVGADTASAVSAPMPGVQGCRALIIYPPPAYFYMPYMGPHQLKAYVEEASSHRVDVLDLNIIFYRSLWLGTSRDLSREFTDAGRRGEAFLAEVLGTFGATAYDELRDDQTYQSAEKVWRASRVLRLAETLTAAHDKWCSKSRWWPTGYDQWPTILGHARDGLIGAFLRQWVTSAPLANYDLVGISASYLGQFGPSLLLASLIKERTNATVVMGGNAVTHLLPELMSDLSPWRWIDFAVPFEGEAMLCDILDSLQGSREPPRTNVVYAESDSVTYVPVPHTKPRVHALPNYSDLVHLYPTPEPILPLLTSKGCYWGKCKFCTHHEGYGQGYYRIDEDRFASTLSSLVGRGARAFYFVDEALPPRTLSRIGEVFANVTKDGRRPPRWMAEARLEKAYAMGASADALAASGCVLLVNGIETGVQRVSDAMAKGIDLEAAALHARHCAESGVQVGWMFFIGYPGEELEESRATFEYIAANSRWVDFASVGVFSLERGAPIYLNPRAHGITSILRRGEPYRVTFAFEATDGLVTHSMLRERLKKLHSEFGWLDGMFAGCSDRALIMFFPPKKRGAVHGSRSFHFDSRFTWASDMTGAMVVWDALEQRIEVTNCSRVASS